MVVDIYSYVRTAYDQNKTKKSAVLGTEVTHNPEFAHFVILTVNRNNFGGLTDLQCTDGQTQLSCPQTVITVTLPVTGNE